MAEIKNPKLPNPAFYNQPGLYLNFENAECLVLSRENIEKITHEYWVNFVLTHLVTDMLADYRDGKLKAKLDRFEAHL